MLAQRMLASTFRQRTLQFGLTKTTSRVASRSLPLLRATRLQSRSAFSTIFTSTSRSVQPRVWRNPAVRRLRNSRHESSKSSQNTAQTSGSQQSLSLSARFKELSRKYGWAAVGVYFGLSVLDFPFCFLAVRLVGPDRVGELEHTIVDGFWHIVGVLLPSMRPQERATVEGAEAEARENGTAELQGVKSKEHASIWTQLLLAYGVHKSLIFFRVPLTAAVTPKVVKTLRSWGWNIGPRVRAKAKP